jgi:hypothetical protein
LVITLAAVVAYSTYITVQLSGLRKLQSDMVDRNRKDSLQLLRLQNDLNTVALAMRDMLDAGERRCAWKSNTLKRTVRRSSASICGNNWRNSGTRWTACLH